MTKCDPRSRSIAARKVLINCFVGPWSTQMPRLFFTQTVEKLLLARASCAHCRTRLAHLSFSIAWLRCGPPNWLTNFTTFLRINCADMGDGPRDAGLDELSAASIPDTTVYTSVSWSDTQHHSSGLFPIRNTNATINQQLFPLRVHPSHH